MEAATTAAAGQCSGRAASSSAGSAGGSVGGEGFDVFEEAQVDKAHRLRRRAQSADDIAGAPPQ
jgi:hypothetical protein